MKKQDIKAGVIYGYAQGTSDYRTASPTIVLDAKGLWTWHRRSGQDRAWKVSSEKRYNTPVGGWSSWQGAHGYLVLHGSRFGTTEEQTQNLATLEELYAEFASSAGNPDAVTALAFKVKNLDGVTLDVVNNRWITGDYAEAKNDEDARDAARKAQCKAERDRAAAERDFLNDVSQIIGAKLEREVVVTSDRSWSAVRASIPMEDLARFLGIQSPQERL